jgi:hypothetical protein
MATVSYNDLNIAGSGKQVIEVICLEQKLESKDPLLAQVWRSIELTLFMPCILGVSYFMAMLTGSC